MVKNCDLGPENAALGLRPRAAFSSPRSQFFTIQTSQPANNIYLCWCICPRTLSVPRSKRFSESVTREKLEALRNR